MRVCAVNQARYAERPPSNGLGVAGFIVSLVGVLATCGALAPVGLLLSGIAMFKRPRGFATTGVVLGLIGTVMISVIAISGVAAVGASSDRARERDEMSQRERARLQVAELAERVGAFHRENGRPPLALDLLPFVDGAMLMDPWGRAFEFEPEIDGFAIRSVGPDGVGFTKDDVVQTWDLARDGIAPRPLKAGATAMDDGGVRNGGSMFGVPVPPVPPVAPAAPTPPTPPVAPEMR